MNMPDGWKRASRLCVRGDYLIWGGDSPTGYYWGVSTRNMALDIGPLREGPFPDFLSCAVACELATGGNTSEPVRV